MVELHEFKSRIEEAKTADEAERITVARDVIEAVGAVLKGAEGVRSIKDLAEELGLGDYVQKIRRGYGFDLANALAEVLDVPPESIFADNSVDVVRDSVIEKVGEVEEIDEVFVPTKSDSVINFKRGSGTYEKPDELPRISLIEEVLGELGIDKTMFNHQKGVVIDDMVRGLPYHSFVIPTLGKIILVCEEEGNVTFVVHSADNVEGYRRAKKDSLKNDQSVGFFEWNSDHDDWKERLKKHLLSDTVIKENDHVVRAEDAEAEVNYFEVKENIIYDLNEFAKALGEDKTVFDLSSSNILTKEIICKNGRRVNGRVYLVDAAKSFGMGETFAEADADRADVFKKLFEIAGYEIMDDEYFKIDAKIKADLLALALKLGADKTPFDLTTGNIQKLEITASNGEKIKGKRYVERFAGALGKEQLASLLERAGYKVMNKAYFQNQENIKFDLFAFARLERVDAHPLDLNASNIAKSMEEVICKNGEKVSGRTYFSRLLRYFVENESLGIEVVYERLLEKAGFQKMNDKYFAVRDNIAFDLAAYLRELGGSISLSDMTAKKIRSKKITCCNGETLVTGDKYLKRAGIALSFALDLSSAGDMQAETLRVLKSRIS